MSIYKHSKNLKYYVYAYLRQDGTPYYIGKGKGKRAFSKNRKCKRPSDISRIIICESNLTEIGAFALERWLIRWYGRKDNGTGILRNLTDGGEGGSGRLVSEHTRKSLSERYTGRTLSEEQKNKLSKSHKGKTLTEEHKQKLSEARKGKRLSEQHKQKLSDARKGKYVGINSPIYGKKFTEEHRKKISEKLKGRQSPTLGMPRSEETKRKISESKKGKPRKNHS